MGRWNHTLKIGDFYHNEALTLGEISGRMEQALRMKFPMRGDEEFLDIVDGFGNIRCDKLPCDPGADDALEEFNSLMSDLYDWADDNRVWIDTLR